MSGAGPRSCRIVPFLFLCCVLHAQQLPFRTFTSRDGLPRSEVHTLCQDSLGYIWCGTFDGFSRYDGASFANYEIPGGLGANAVNSLFPVAGGKLWVATNGGGLSRWDDGRIRRYLVNPEDPLSQENRVNVVCTFGSGMILAGTDRGAFLFDGERFERFRPGSISASTAVDLLFRDRSGAIWIGTSAGMFVMNDSAGSPCRRLDIPDSPHVNAIAGDTAGGIWFATDAGIRRLTRGDRPAELPRVMQPPFPLRALSRTRARALLVDRQGALWIGTDEDGLFRYSAGHLTNYTTTNGLPASRVSSLMEDRESNIWVATNAGLCRLGTRRIVNYTLSGKLAHIYVSAIAQDPAGRIWFGTPYGLTSLRGERFTNYSVTDGLYSGYILSLLVDRAGTVWIGTGGGLNRASGGRILRDPWNPAGSGRTTVMRSFFQDRDANVWVGWERGFSVFRGRRVTDFLLPDSLLNTLVVALCRGPGGSLWVGTQGEGLFRYSVGSDASGHLTVRSSGHYGRKEGLTDVNIRSLLADREGTLWVGTRYGGAERLFFSGDSVCRIAQYGSAEGLAGDWVMQMLQDHDGNLWFATNRGVDRLPVNGGMQAVRLNATHGMAGDDAEALCEDRDGQIWIGATNGVTRYSPGEEQAVRVPPPVYLQRFQVLGLDDSLALGRGTADLGFDQHSVSFEYIGLSYTDETAVRYRYMLEGIDPEWSPPTVRRYVTYAHLPPGSYTFRVAACAGETGWSPHPASFSFRIAAPFWASPLFIGGVVLCALASVFGIHRARVGRLVAMERVRNRIAADLHDDIGSTVSSISVFSRLAEEELGESAPGAVSIIRRIGASSQRVMESLDDIVWMIRPGNDSLDVITSRIREYATAMFEARGIRFTLSMPPGLDEMRMSLEDRRQLYLIIKEAVNNIVKHSSCSFARLVIAVHKKDLLVTIQDDGQGFDSSLHLRGNGIANMRERGSAMGGHLTIESGTEGGTTINLRTRIT
jgi:ligand-binding sensor domain-containing protein/signal transduction histidine kinase